MRKTLVHRLCIAQDVEENIVALSVKVKLVDKNKKARGNIELAVGFYRSSSTGSISTRRTGRTSSAGTATLVLADNLGTYLPRIVLRMKRSGRWVTLSDNPETYNSSLADFGTLEIATTALKINTKLAVFAINNSVSSSLNSQISALQADKTSLSSQISTLSREKSSLSSSVSKLTKDKQSLSSTITRLNQDKTNLSRTNSTLSRQVSALTSEKNTLSGRVSALTRDTQNLTREKNALANSLEAANDTNAELQATKRSLEQQVSSLNSAKTNAERSLSGARAQYNNEKKARDRLQAQNTSLNKNLTDKNAQIEQLTQQLAEKNPDELPIADVFDNTAKEFESAQEKLKKRKSQFRLGKISMQIKGVPGKTANTLRMLDKENKEGVTPESLSVYNIEFDARKEVEATAPSQVVVPTLEGYTRRIAERKLLSAGLNPLWLEEHLGRGETAESQHGRVIRQDPPSHAQVDRGADVYVTVGKAVLSSKNTSGEVVDG